MGESSRHQLDQRVRDSYRDWGWSPEVLGAILIGFGIGTIPLVLAWTKPLLGSNGTNYAGAMPGAVMIATGIALVAVPLLRVMGHRAIVVAVGVYALIAVLVIAMLCLVPRPSVVGHHRSPVPQHQQPPPSDIPRFVASTAGGELGRFGHLRAAGGLASRLVAE